MTDHFDTLETRGAEQRETEQFAELRRILAAALPQARGLAAHLDGADIAALTGPAALAGLPVLRKADLAQRQTGADPLGGLAARAPGAFRHLFMSPGPIFEPGGGGADWSANKSGFSENYGYAGSAENYRETVNHSLDKALVSMVNDPGFRDALCK